MKKLLTLAVLFTLVIVSCEQPLDEEITPKLPTLTITNQSSYILTDVKFSGITFASSGNDLAVSAQAQKEIPDDTAKTGYVTFVRKDIGISCRTQIISVPDEGYTFTFLDDTTIEQVGNSGNISSLDSINFVSTIALEYDGKTVPKNDMADFSEIIINKTMAHEFTIKSTGEGKLTLTGISPITVSGENSDVFTIVQPVSSEITTEKLLTFKINFTPKAEQIYNAKVTIKSNAQGGDFTFTITAKGVSPKPIAAVFFDDAEIAQNGTITTDETYMTQSTTFNVIIKNTGTEVLNISLADITITGTDADAFTIVNNPGSSISAGSQSSFGIAFRPLKTGNNYAELRIPTNDTSRNPIIILLQAAGKAGSAVLSVTQGTTAVDSTGITALDFGQVTIGEHKSLIFTLKNTGNIALTLIGSPLVESSQTPFSILTQPASAVIQPNAEMQFVLRYTPSAEDDETSRITILHSGDGNELSFNVTGKAYQKRPQINIKQGDAVVTPHDEYNFGSVFQVVDKKITFTIENTGEANLLFINVDGNRVDLENDTEETFSVTSQPSSIVAPGAVTDFTVQFSPVSVGNFIATVVVSTNSEDNAEFSFTVKGNKRDYYIIGDTGPGGGTVFYDKGISSDGWRYMEAAPAVTEFTAEWGEYNSISIGAGFGGILGTQQNVGSGAVNTTLIVNYFKTQGKNGTAAQLCDALDFNGYTDWFLPSRNELDLMYKNLRINGKGGFKTDYSYYWSSSQDQIGAAWCQSFDDGSQVEFIKSRQLNVRAVRVF